MVMLSSFGLPAWLGLVSQGVVVAGFCSIAWSSIVKRYSPDRLSAYSLLHRFEGLPSGIFSSMNKLLIHCEMVQNL